MYGYWNGTHQFSLGPAWKYLKPWEVGVVHGVHFSEYPPEPSSGTKTYCCSTPKLPQVPYIELSAAYVVYLQMALTMICHSS